MNDAEQIKRLRSIVNAAAAGLEKMATMKEARPLRALLLGLAQAMRGQIYNDAAADRADYWVACADRFPECMSQLPGAGVARRINECRCEVARAAVAQMENLTFRRLGESTG